MVAVERKTELTPEQIQDIVQVKTVIKDCFGGVLSLGRGPLDKSQKFTPWIDPVPIEEEGYPSLYVAYILREVISGCFISDEGEERIIKTVTINSGLRGSGLSYFSSQLRLPKKDAYARISFSKAQALHINSPYFCQLDGEGVPYGGKMVAIWNGELCQEEIADVRPDLIVVLLDCEVVDQSQAYHGLVLASSQESQ